MPQENNIIPILDTEEKMQLGREIAELERVIISSWIQNREIQELYEKYHIGEEEVHHYIEYF